MEFSGVTKATANATSATIKRILIMNISPAAKRARIAATLIAVGGQFHEKVFADVSNVFGATMFTTAGVGDLSDRVGRLSTTLMRDYALSREQADTIIATHYNALLGLAENEAAINARSLGRQPTLYRELNPARPDCDWCIDMSGEHENPDGEVFGRHEKCDCIFITKGFNTRNGLLTNFAKRSQ